METELSSINGPHPENRTPENSDPVEWKDWIRIGFWTTTQGLLWAVLICVIFLAVPEFQELLEEFEVGTTWITERLLVTSMYLRRLWPILLFAIPGLIVADASLLFVAKWKPELRTLIRMIRFVPLAVVTLWIAIGIGLPLLAML